MARKDERLKYALSFKGKGMENEELKENIQLAILDGAVWAGKASLCETCAYTGGYCLKNKMRFYKCKDYVREKDSK